MKKIFFCSIALSLFFISTYAQNINGRFSSAIYSFERFDTVNVSNTYFRAYEMLSLNFNKDNYSLRTYLNLGTDLSQDLTYDPRLRFYNLYFEARKVFDGRMLNASNRACLKMVNLIHTADRWSELRVK